jgi:DNA uptake protein ComE-like DNA-binding protein
MKRIWKDYFSFSKKERIAIVVLAVIMAAFIAAPYLYTHDTPLDPVLPEKLFSYPPYSDRDKDTVAATHMPANPAPAALFYFDPNTLDQQGWQQLGIADRTITTILRYRSKGGRFRKPADIRKIWGMRQSDAERLEPYIHIKADTVIHASRERKYQAPASKAPASPIDINTATIENWKQLPGIGDILAARIVKYRERSGGFVSTAQVRKTYGISDSLFTVILPYLQFRPGSLPAIDINSASAYALRTKLDIPFRDAYAIVKYRDQHGPFHSLNDIPKLVPMHDSVSQKLMLRGKTDQPEN